MPSSLAAQITRSAISPRLAIRIFLNILPFAPVAALRSDRASVNGVIRVTPPQHAIRRRAGDPAPPFHKNGQKLMQRAPSKPFIGCWAEAARKHPRGENESGPDQLRPRCLPWPVLPWANLKQRLAVFDRLAIGDKDLDDGACSVGFDFIHQLHRLE